MRTCMISMIGCRKKVIIGYIQNCVVLLSKKQKDSQEPIRTLQIYLGH
jgi:hypothetical protein